MLVVSDLIKTYSNGDKTQGVLNGVSFSLAHGELAAIVGRSGSGKSTLLNIIAGLEAADSGRVEIASISMSGITAEQAAQVRLESIGLVFQFFNFLPTLTLEQNVSLPGYLSGRTRKQVRARASECLEQVGILGLANRLPHEVSGGELQRAAVARAISNKPQLLLADEPTGNLDSENARTVLDIFLTLCRETKTTALLITHDQELAAATDRVLTLSDGTIQ